MCVALSFLYGFLPADIFRVGPENCLEKYVKKMMLRKSVKEKLSIVLGVPERLISFSFPDLKRRGTLLQLTRRIRICPLSSRWCFCWLSSPPCYLCHWCSWSLARSFQKQDRGEEGSVSLLAPNPSLSVSKVDGLLCSLCCCLVGFLFDFLFAEPLKNLERCLSKWLLPLAYQLVGVGALTTPPGPGKWGMDSKVIWGWTLGSRTRLGWTTADLWKTAAWRKFSSKSFQVSGLINIWGPLYGQ